MRQKFDPLDLELIDRVYEVGCAYIEARNLYRDEKQDSEEEDALGKMVFTLAGTGPLHFDTLLATVMESMDEYRLCARSVQVPKKVVAEAA
jgi:hypothetical protein